MSPSGPEIQLSDLQVGLPGHALPVVEKLNLSVSKGTICGIYGNSGAGKTTLLHAIAGLVPWLRPGVVDGTIKISADAVNDLDPGQRAHLMATCLDRATAQLFLSTPREEMAAAKKQHGATPLVDAALDELGLRPHLDRRSTELSSGERQRLTLAVALAACPRPVLLDEPLAHLDAESIEGLKRLLFLVKAAGGCVLLTEQAGWRLSDVVTEWWSVENKRIAVAAPPDPPHLSPPGHMEKQETLLTLDGLTVHRDGKTLIENIDLRLEAGEVVLISGANGSGKSTLAEVIAGFRKPARGTIDRRGPIALMLPTAELQLFATTVAAEVRSGSGRAPEARVLRRHRLEHLAARPPWTLSRGEQQRLVHAALDLQRPPIMVVDEPAQGLGPEDLGNFVDLMHRRAERGRAYIVISHREEIGAAAHRHLRIENGSLVPC